MKSTGIVRNVDELGRIVLPKELRRTMNIEVKDPLEFFVDGEYIVLKKYKPEMTCMVTGKVSDGNLKFVDGKIILSREGLEQVLKELEELMVR